MLGAVLAILAAVVPILASCYVAGSVLAEHAHQSHVARVYERVWGWYQAERERLDREVSVHDSRFQRLSKELTARRMMLLEMNGVDPWTGTAKALGESGFPKPPPAAERRRQWVLLWGSLVGVFFLAMSLL
ncbi:MAG: hypothetical protein CMH35_01790 [Microbacterium sp.]|nr:hypothetical protein [Microbacterium sp.]|tara:strand:- start:252 stop:644 length:393 start_codon:yes stop_codon:yes gene_type:complete